MCSVHPAVQLADSPRRPTRGDLLLVAGFLAWALLEAFFVNHPGPAWARALVAIGFVIPLLWRRPAPIVTIAAIATVAAARAFTVHIPDDGAMPFPALLVATFSVGLYVRRLWLSLALRRGPDRARPRAEPVAGVARRAPRRRLRDPQLLRQRRLDAPAT